MRSFIVLITLYSINCGFLKANNQTVGLPLNAMPIKTYRLGKTNLFNQVYFESGVKFSSNPDTTGNLNNSQIGLQHKITNKLSLFHAYNYLAQDNIWGNITQQSYYANFEYTANSKVKFNFVGSYLYNKVKVLSSSGTTFSKRGNLFFLASSTIKLKKWSVKPLVSYSQLDNITNSGTQYQLGGELLYDLKGTEALVFGLGVYHFDNNSLISTLVKPSVSAIINDELAVSVDYLYTNARNYSDQDGYVIYNSVDKTYDRSNLTLRYEFANNVFLYGVYQFERKQDHTSLTKYNFNNIFLGIKYNL